MNLRTRPPFAWLALAPAIVFACAEDSDPPKAEGCGFVGESVACACTDGRTGAQTCLKNGTLSECLCTGDVGEAGASGTSGGPGSGGASTDGGSAGSPQGGEGPSDGGDGGMTGGSASGGDRGGGTGGGPGGMSGRSGSGGAGGRAGSGGGTTRECDVGDLAGCSCSGGPAGYRPCTDGSFGVCVCTDAGTGGRGGMAGAGGLAGGAGTSGSGGTDCIPEAEWCDGRDNDCNGNADDQFACRDDAVRNTRPFTRGVYFAGDSQSGNAIQQVWPTVSRSFLTGFDTYVRWYQFRRTDDALFYGATFSGILRDVAGTADPAEPTPSCTSSSVSTEGFGFDGQERLHYRCGSSLRRGNGELVADPITAISGVFDDGRVLVLRSVGTNASVYVLIDASGVELIRFPSTGLFTGSMTPVFDATSVDGNVAYLLLNRRYDQETDEIVVYMIDEASRFRLVRRVVVQDLGAAALAVSDGTIFVQDAELIRAYLPDNTTRIVWRADEAIHVHPSLFEEQLMVGPPEP